MEHTHTHTHTWMAVVTAGQTTQGNESIRQDDALRKIHIGGVQLKARIYSTRDISPYPMLSTELQPRLHPEFCKLYFKKISIRVSPIIRPASTDNIIHRLYNAQGSTRMKVLNLCTATSVYVRCGSIPICLSTHSATFTKCNADMFSPVLPPPRPVLLFLSMFSYFRMHVPHYTSRNSHFNSNPCLSVLTFINHS
jgi:hypothetical protein